jgi:transposase-like protein
VDEGRSISEVVRELGTGQSLLHRWKKKSKEGKPVFLKFEDCYLASKISTSTYPKHFIWECGNQLLDYYFSG